MFWQVEIEIKSALMGHIQLLRVHDHASAERILIIPASFVFALNSVHVVQTFDAFRNSNAVI
jgi:hypothetical protein